MREWRKQEEALPENLPEWKAMIDQTTSQATRWIDSPILSHIIGTIQNMVREDLAHFQKEKVDI